MPDKTIKEIIEVASMYWAFASFWWLALYLNMVRKWAKFNFFMLVINLVISAWIWVTMYYLLPESIGEIKIWLVSISGFLSYPILNFLEENALDLFIKRFLWNIKK